MIIISAPTHNFTYAGCTHNVFHVNTGEGLLKHQHLFNHATICHAGSVKISLEGRNYILKKDSQPLDLPANEWHEIEALEDGTVFVNVFAEGKY